MQQPLLLYKEEATMLSRNTSYSGLVLQALCCYRTSCVLGGLPLAAAVRCFSSPTNSLLQQNVWQSCQAGAVQQTLHA